jgi:hypothetical protein
MRHDIYISSSWKMRDQVRQLADRLQETGLSVYDFTNPACRDSPEIPPEEFPEQFDPEKHDHGDYLRSVPVWRDAMDSNRKALDNCSIVVLLLPCGLDAHADAYYALGRGKRLIVCGSPHKGDRTLTHLWAEVILPSPQDVVAYLEKKKTTDRTQCGSKNVELASPDLIQIAEDLRNIVYGSLDVPQALKCQSTGNPCGTDTWQVGIPCLCDHCQLWYALFNLSKRMCSALNLHPEVLNSKHSPISGDETMQAKPIADPPDERNGSLGYAACVLRFDCHPCSMKVEVVSPSRSFAGWVRCPNCRQPMEQTDQNRLVL